MKHVAEMTQGELAAYIDSHLQERNIDVVLSGGATVAVYSNHKYVSKDLDFINRFLKARAEIVEAMGEIGFHEDGRYFVHPDTAYFVEFISGPATVGSEPIREIRHIEMETGVLRVISPTDSVKDRLAAFYHWKDQQGLEQALLVASENKVDLVELQRWSAEEGKQQEFREFESRLRTTDAMQENG